MVDLDDLDTVAMGQKPYNIQGDEGWPAPISCWSLGCLVLPTSAWDLQLVKIWGMVVDPLIATLYITSIH